MGTYLNIICHHFFQEQNLRIFSLIGVSYSFSPILYYNSPLFCDINQSNEVEDAEHDARLSDMMKQILEQNT